MPFITSLSNKLPHLKQRQGSNYLVSYSYHRAQRGREHSSLIIDCEYLRFLPSLIINCGDSKTKDEQSSDFKVVRFWYERQVCSKLEVYRSSNRFSTWLFWVQNSFQSLSMISHMFLTFQDQFQHPNPNWNHFYDQKKISILNKQKCILSWIAYSFNAYFHRFIFHLWK